VKTGTQIHWFGRSKLILTIAMFVAAQVFWKMGRIVLECSTEGSRDATMFLWLCAMLWPIWVLMMRSRVLTWAGGLEAIGGGAYRACSLEELGGVCRTRMPLGGEWLCFVDRSGARVTSWLPASEVPDLVAWARARVDEIPFGRLALPVRAYYWATALARIVFALWFVMIVMIWADLSRLEKWATRDRIVVHTNIRPTN
jgi:hypothetical protein